MRTLAFLRWVRRHPGEAAAGEVARGYRRRKALEAELRAWAMR